MTSQEYEKREMRRYEDVVATVGTNNDIKHEVAGDPPPGGLKSWQAYWLDKIKGFEEEDNPRFNRYIKYIIIKRHEAGLPPLEGYPPDQYLSDDAPDNSE